jgi:hypothetical protein
MLSVIMLSVIMLSDIMLSVIMLSVIMLNVVVLNALAPRYQLLFIKANSEIFMMRPGSPCGAPL